MTLKKNMKKGIITLLIATMGLSFVGCSKEAKQEDNEQQTASTQASQYENIYPDFIVGEDENSVTYIDYKGEKTTVTKKPKRVVVVYNSVLDLWYEMGGQAIARVKGTINVPEEAKNIEDLGSWNKLSIETLVALKPDLVIMMNTDSQRKFLEPLKDNNIEYAYIDASTNAYEAFKKNSYLFSKLLGTEDTYNEKINQIVAQCEDIIKKANESTEKPSVAVLFSTSKSIKTETEKSLTGEMVHLLGATNIASSDEVTGETRIVFSMEELIARDPDFILISTMGDIEKCKERINNDIKNNEAFKSLKAVKNGNVYFLPKEYSVYKPNVRYPQAMQYLAEILYKEVFK